MFSSRHELSFDPRFASDVETGSTRSVRAADPSPRHAPNERGRSSTTGVVAEGVPLEILKLASRGFTDKAISRELGLSEGAVDYHWRKLKRALGATDRTMAVWRGLGAHYESTLASAEVEISRLKAKVDRLESGTAVANLRPRSHPHD